MFDRQLRKGFEKSPFFWWLQKIVVSLQYRLENSYLKKEVVIQRYNLIKYKPNKSYETF